MTKTDPQPSDDRLPGESDLLRLATEARAVAFAELRIERPIDIIARRQPIIHAGTGAVCRGGYNPTEPDRIYISAQLRDCAEIVEVTRHELAHAAGFGHPAANYFGVGIRPRWVDGVPTLPETPTLVPADWPAELWPAGMLDEIERMRQEHIETGRPVAARDLPQAALDAY